MKLINKNILLISPEPWEHIFVSKHHYATHLGNRGNKVYFLNPPGFSHSVTKTKFKNVWSINYQGFQKGLRFFPRFMQHYFILKIYNRLQQKLQLKFDIIWSFDNSVFYDFNALPTPVFKISHIVDLNQNFQTKLATQTANTCFGVTNEIVTRLKKYQSKSYFINHGFNSHSQSKLANLEVPGKSKIKVLYAGNLAMRYLDWEPLYNISKNNPSIDFIFIGPNAEDFSLSQNPTQLSKRKATQLKNTYFIGKLEAKELQNWYKASDILLVSYQEKFHKDQSNPHKMMEYLGAGKMIIATNTQEYKTLAQEELIAMSDKNKSFSQLFNDVVKNIDTWNAKEKTEKRIVFALNNTYNKQIERIESLIR